MMDRRAFIADGVAALAVPLGARAQQAEKVYRIGYLLLVPLAESRRRCWRGADQVIDR
jgi:hypothetical protein